MPYFGIPIRNGLSLGLGAVASLSTDFALRPSLDLIFAGADALDSQVTFSRGSNATYFDSAGVLKYAPNNLLTYSEAFNTTPDWTATRSSITADATTSPDGTANADKLVEDTTASSTHSITQAFNFVSGTTYTFSIFVKAAERSAVRVLFPAAAFTSNLIANFDIAAGSWRSSSPAPSAGLTLNASDIGNGWYRISASAVATASSLTTILLYLLNSPSSTGSYTGDGTSGLYIWGAQLNVGDLQPYYPTQATAYYGPRLDYNPATLAARGLLIEEQRTNNVLRSQDFSTGWTASQCTITAASGIGPDGTNTAGKLVMDSAVAPASSRSVYQDIAGITGVQTISIFAKAVEFNVLRISARSAANTTLVGPDFTLSGAGSFGALGSATSASITSVGNGWYRCVATFDLLTGATAVRPYYASTQATGDGTSGILVWGAQLE